MSGETSSKTKKLFKQWQEKLQQESCGTVNVQYIYE